MVENLERISARALIPDQLLPYVRAVSGLDSIPAGEGILHYGAGQGILAVYSQASPNDQRAIDEATQKALEIPGLTHLTVIASSAPKQAPPNANKKTDSYWLLPIPYESVPGKVAYMIRRAARDLRLEQSSGKNAWTSAHDELAHDFCRRKRDRLDAGSIYLFQQLRAYLDESPETVLFSAWRNDGESLAGLAVGDFTALQTAFYMFAFRSPDAPPGTADALLWAMINEGKKRGHCQINLGLGIDPGVEFFKSKWGARKFLPYVETDWKLAPPAKKGFLARLFGK